MACDVPCMSYMALYVISMHIVSSSSRSSSSSHHNHWKLNLASGKVEPVSAEQETTSPTGSSKITDRSDSNSNGTSFHTDATTKTTPPSEEVFQGKVIDILSQTINGGGDWVVAPPSHHTGHVHTEEHMQKCCHDDSSLNQDSSQTRKSKDSSKSTKGKSSNSRSKAESPTEAKDSVRLKALSCGKKVSSTQYDNLTGIAERHRHSHIPEPDVAMVFQSSGRSSEVDMNELEKTLRKAKRDVEKENNNEKTAQVYNLIGNFWRIKGNTQSSIECFRKALSISPGDPNILLNLARVLFNLQYLDDAIFLVRRSLSLQPPEENAWMHHFTLGEILKSYGHSQEAAQHFQLTLKLNPGFQPAQSHLRDLTSSQTVPSIAHLSFFIILFLVIGLLFGIVTSLESSFSDSGLVDGSKQQQRHFNRAMAMRSIKLGINPRLCRLRKANS